MLAKTLDSTQTIDQDTGGYWLPEIRRHGRLLAIRVLNFLVHRRSVLTVIGYLNSRSQFLSTVFVAYLATDEYSQQYVSGARRERIRWSPWLAGIFIQGGKLGLMFVISATEADFRDAANRPRLRQLLNETIGIQQRVNAGQMSFSGVLPGVFCSHRMLRKPVEPRVTVEVIVRAEGMLRAMLAMDDDVPVVLVGGAGFIGRRVAARMADRKLHIVDKVLDPEKEGPEKAGQPWYSRLQGKRVVIINLASPRALTDYAQYLWPEAAVLNEVYPEPDADTLAVLDQAGCPVFHIVGMKARSWPPFPHAYRGGIPCCAGRLEAISEPIISRLNGSARG